MATQTIEPQNDAERRLQELSTICRSHENLARGARAQRDAWIRDLVALGVTMTRIGDLAGIGRQQVANIVAMADPLHQPLR